MAPNNPEIPFEKKIRAVSNYLSGGRTLRRIARRYSISCSTLWEWVKIYKDEGPEALKVKRIPRRRLLKENEKKVMMIKEQRPWISVQRAHRELKKSGIQISHNGIWLVWCRYGLAKRSKLNPLSPFACITPETGAGIKKAEFFLKEGNVQKAAKTLNDLPCLPETPVLKRVPEKLLSARRRLELLYLQFGKIPFPEFEKKAHRLAVVLEKKDFHFSSILARFLEVYALGWMGKPEYTLKALLILKNKMRNLTDSSLWFLYYCQCAMAYCRLLKIDRALECVKKCYRLIHLLPSRAYDEQFGNLLTFLGKFKDATKYYRKVLRYESETSVVGRVLLKAAYLSGIAGEYNECRKLFTRARLARYKGVLGSAMYSLTRANIYFGRGDLEQATTCFQQSLVKASKGELFNQFYSTSTGLAAVAMALNNATDAKKHLEKCYAVMKKCGLSRELLIVSQLLNKKQVIPSNSLHMPTLRLIQLLVNARKDPSIGNYRKAQIFAEKQKLLGLFYRWVVFFHTSVECVLEKGRPTGLPKTILNFPLFNQQIPVYHLRFLGDVTVLKGAHVLRIKPTPQERAFLIHLALRAGTPGRSILLDDVCTNFWRGARKPLDLLSHLLVRIKKQLRLPGHLLSISSRQGSPRLINRGMYITTDYGEFETLLAEILSFERAGEWQFAKDNYLRLLELMRGRPFYKMYDNWSDECRLAILNKYEKTIVRFAKGCFAHNDRKTALDSIIQAKKIVQHIYDGADIKTMKEKL